EAKQVDVDGEKVWLEFSKDGEYVDDEIISVGTGDNTWTVELDDIQGEDDVDVLKVHVNQVFQGAVDSIAQIEGIWLIDYANAMKIESDDEFGELNDVSINGATLKISNEDTFTLTRDSDQEIGEGMSFKVADTPSTELRYYPFVEKTLGNETGTTPEGNETTPEDNVTTPVEGETTTEEEPTEGTPAENNTSTEPETPGFEVVPGIVGLLAVVYLVRRNN
ncbi:MAG: S-layer protein domain-containing protein, partial [Methanosarcina sp.]